MISINESVKKSLIERFQPPKVFENVIDLNDLDFLLKQEEENSQKKVVSTKRVFGLNTTAATDYLRPLLDKILEYPYKITGGNFFRTQVPYRLHADSGIDEQIKLYRIVVVPLQLELDGDYREEFNCLTVTNQRWFHQAAFFMKGEEEKFDVKKLEYNQPINQYDLIYNLGDSLPRERFSSFYDHLVYENFDGINEQSVIPWRVGNIITFDRSNIHTATNFHKANVKTKIGLSIFTEYADL